MLKFIMRQQGPAPGMLRKEWNKLARACWEAVGALWHGKIRPKHFTAGGAIEYRYRKRSAAYERRKQRLRGHKLPLVWSGRSLERSARMDVRPKSRGVRVVLNTPALNFRPRTRSGRPLTGKTPKEEMTTVTGREADRLARRWAQTLEKLMSRMRTEQVDRL